MVTTTERISSFWRDGLCFDVSDDGPLDGEVVVLLHGFPTDRSCWDAVSSRLAAAGLRTLAPDQRGYSPGARPASRHAYRLEELVGDVLALVDATGRERVHVVGHDWGGSVAWLLAGAAPERVASLTVLSTPHPGALARALRTPGQALRSWYVAAFQLPALPELVFSRLFRRALRRTGLPVEQTERYAARLAHPAALTGPLNWYRAVRSSRLRAHRSSVPTTLVWGRDDFALGRRAAELTREHVTGPYELVELDAGHWLPETRSQECADAIVHRVASAR